MTVRKIAKLVGISVVSILVVIVLFIIRQVAYGLKYHDSYHDPLSVELIASCIHHKEVTHMRDNQPPLTEPLYSDEQLTEWLRAALANIVHFDSSNLKRQVLADERYFTPDGWCEFINALSGANIITATVQRKLSVDTILQGSPTITRSFRVNGTYTWLVEIPVSFKFKALAPSDGASLDIPDQKLMLRIERSLAPADVDGIGISQWVTVPAS